MKIITTQIHAKDLKPGDLFSGNPEFWNSPPNPKSIGRQLYIRLDSPCPKNQEQIVVIKIEIVQDMGSAPKNMEVKNK